MSRKKESFTGNLIYAMVAQTISLLLSVAMSLLVPKVLGVTEYSYWQLFLFYTTYTGFFHLGINDGMYLQLGGKKYQEIDFPLLKGQLIILCVMQLFLFCAITGVSFFVTKGNRTVVLIIAAVYMILFNISGYLGYMFQAVNNTRTYSLSIMIDKLFFLICVALLLFRGEDSFIPFMILYILSKTISTIYLAIEARTLFEAKASPIIRSIREAILNASIGIRLLLANIASLLILGIGRMIIDNIWGIETFGKLSFSISLTNFFLLFVSQVSMVLFPALRRVDGNSQSQVYILLREMLSLLLPIILLGYIPVKIIIGIWLPAYTESMRYLALLLPLCTFDAKMQMLCNTYFKVLRKEKLLLNVNIISMIISAVLCLIGGYVLHSVPAIAVFMVFAIAFRSIISEMSLAKMMDCSIIKKIIPEIFVTVIFMIVSWNMSNFYAFILYLAAYILYVLTNKKSVLLLIHNIKNRKR